ncbi:MAG TPA: hypothetical protein PKK26_14510, partial [Candidatus Wallbacteria bacterium]|nr:hypothetical protein [Candidatus Wallbacteria bacterium]
QLLKYYFNYFFELNKNLDFKNFNDAYNNAYKIRELAILAGVDQIVNCLDEMIVMIKEKKVKQTQALLDQINVSFESYRKQVL